MRALLCACTLIAAGVVAGCASSSRPNPTPLDPLTPTLSARSAWNMSVDAVQFPLTVAVNGNLHACCERRQRVCDRR